MTRGALMPVADGLRREDGVVYPFLHLPDDTAEIPDFTRAAGSAGPGRLASLAMYASDEAEQVYDNFLAWLFATFGVAEAAFRADLAARLAPAPGGTVLVTGCGLGDDVAALAAAVGPGGTILAQDLSPAMAASARRRLVQSHPDLADRVHFAVGDATRLPFGDGALDAAFHFGGINLFDGPAAAIAEMSRVVRPGGRVLIGDEGVSPWLRDTDYGRMVIVNNRLWAHEAPLERLPVGSRSAALTWVLGDCFWILTYEVGSGPPAIDPHVAHKGRRGGTMWTRWTGGLEPVTPETRVRVEAAAAAAGVSVHDWLEAALARALPEAT